MRMPQVLRTPRIWPSRSLRSRINRSRAPIRVRNLSAVSLLTCTAVNQPVRTRLASPSASARSDWLSFADSALCALRASMQVTGRLSFTNPRCSQIESWPLSCTIRSGVICCFARKLATASGSVSTVPRTKTAPSTSTTQIEISLSDTSSPAYCFMVVLLYGCSCEAGDTRPRSPSESDRRNHTMFSVESSTSRQG